MFLLLFSFHMFFAPAIITTIFSYSEVEKKDLKFFKVFMKRKREKRERKKITGCCIIRTKMVESSLLMDLGGFFGLDDFSNSIIHLLDGLEFSESHATLVWDVIDAANGFGVLSSCSADLQVVFSSNFFKTSVVWSQFWNLDVDWSTDGCSQVSWAECKLFKDQKSCYCYSAVKIKKLTNPKRSLWLNGIRFSTSLTAVVKRRKTSPKFPPICMEMIRRWSSSLHQTKKVLASLW